MKSFPFLFILIYAFFQLNHFGCHSPVEPTQTQELIPLAVGNEWLYHRWYAVPTIVDTMREVVLNDYNITLGDNTYTVYGYQRFHHTVEYESEAPKEKILSKDNMYDFYSLYESDKFVIPYQWLRANTEHGVYSFGGISQTDTLFLKNIHYKYPGSVGDEWEYPEIAYHFIEQEFSIGDTRTFELVGMNDKFESDIADYDGCYVYRWSEMGTYPPGPIYWWYHYAYIKPGIGVVAVHTRDVDNPEHIVGQWILIDYTLK
jgi:hypothetical protein